MPDNATTLTAFAIVGGLFALICLVAGVCSWLDDHGYL